MTIQEVHDAFRFRMDKFDSLNYPNFLSTEIDLLGTQAEQRVIKQRYGTTNTKRQSFEETQKRTEDLKNVVVNAVLIPAAYASDNIDTNAAFVTLPNDHWFIVQERCEVEYLDCHDATVNKLVKVIPISHNEFDRVIDDPFNKPNKDKVLRLMENGRVELIYDPSVNIKSYRLRYIKEPTPLSLAGGITFTLSEHLHDELVDEMVKIALEGVEARRNQTYPQIDLTKE
jgi:hypothetical protein